MNAPLLDAVAHALQTVNPVRHPPAARCGPAGSQPWAQTCQPDPFPWSGGRGDRAETLLDVKIEHIQNGGVSPCSRSFVQCLGRLMGFHICPPHT